MAAVLNKIVGKKVKSFTLVELMVIVAILAVLTTLAIPNVIKARMSANDVMAQTTLKSISSALETYFSKNNGYPAVTDDLLDPDPPYLNKDYFLEPYAGFVFTYEPDGTTEYAVLAEPTFFGRTGTTTFVITTGGVFQEY